MGRDTASSSSQHQQRDTTSPSTPLTQLTSPTNLGRTSPSLASLPTSPSRPSRQPHPGQPYLINNTINATIPSSFRSRLLTQGTYSFQKFASESHPKNANPSLPTYRPPGFLLVRHVKDGKSLATHVAWRCVPCVVRAGETALTKSHSHEPLEPGLVKKQQQAAAAYTGCRPTPRSR